ncbi:hypothetical protein HanPI659440_Chr12g0465661 [Helianthus annuus]|nr:hypothetical protein HanPI659440_Chr12g0465661 [Helianthus annuus]
MILVGVSKRLKNTLFCYLLFSFRICSVHIVYFVISYFNIKFNIIYDSFRFSNGSRLGFKISETVPYVVDESSNTALMSYISFVIFVH